MQTVIRVHFFNGHEETYDYDLFLHESEGSIRIRHDGRLLYIPRENVEYYEVGVLDSNGVLSCKRE